MFEIKEKTRIEAEMLTDELRKQLDIDYGRLEAEAELWELKEKREQQKKDTETKFLIGICTSFIIGILFMILASWTTEPGLNGLLGIIGGLSIIICFAHIFVAIGFALFNNTD